MVQMAEAARKRLRASNVAVAISQNLIFVQRKSRHFPNS
jgi:hypothetical protein